MIKEKLLEKKLINPRIGIDSLAFDMVEIKSIITFSRSSVVS
jgi:hypothetical protein